MMGQGRFEHVDLDSNGGVLKLVLDRPPLNILNIQMLNEINAVLEEAAGDRSIKLLIITGRGKAFSAGVDVAEHLPDKAELMLATFRRTFDLLASIEAPTLAAINGAALGGGCEVAIFCDLVIAAEGATLGQPEVRLATLAPVAAALMPGLCGMKKALELLLTGDTISAHEAQRLGLVNRVVAGEQLEAETGSLARRLTGLSSAALRLIKKATLEGFRQRLFDRLDLTDMICLDMLLNLEDTQEGLRAFLEKRQPDWKGK
ncbi:MAG TPA: enoyl-CoA hydratase/isomerase family protein [Blastocatellia bacterium]|nr:enoyl-CoA hydratase/isomerase family protein [Blastocatellia bacterium]